MALTVIEESPITTDLDDGRDIQVGGRRFESLRKRLACRKWPLLMSLFFMAAGAAFMFGWDPLVHHIGAWDTGDDLWGMFRAAHYVDWGFLGGVYTPSNGVISFPGMAVLLAPVALLTGHLHLVESAPLIFVPRPTAALILQPVELILASTVIFAADALSERLEVSRHRRILLCVVVAAIAWPIAAVWGHAEDALAMTFAMYAMVAMADRKWSRCGWLMGFGIVIQPLVVLLVPLFIGASPSGRRVGFAIRSAALSVVLVMVAFAGDAADTYRALVKEPTPPAVNHPTPWIAFAPKVSTDVPPTGRVATAAPQLGHPVLTQATSAVHAVVFVAGGPGRSIDVMMAILFGLYVWRRPQSTVRLLWLAAVVLASRCFFEAVMTPYYIAPPLLLALVLSSRQGGKRFWASVILALEITIFAYHHLKPWVWWLPIVGGLAAILALGYPGDLTSAPESLPEVTAYALPAEGESRSPEPSRPLQPIVGSMRAIAISGS
jgi:hypothetical protein